MSSSNSSYWGDTHYQGPVREVTCRCNREGKNRKHDYNALTQIYTCQNCGHQSGPGVANESGCEDENEEDFYS